MQNNVLKKTKLTLPNVEKNSLMSSAVVEAERPPTKTFLVRVIICIKDNVNYDIQYSTQIQFQDLSELE